MQKQTKMITTNRHHGRWRIWLALGLILAPVLSVSAQNSPALEISPPNTEQFPRITLYLDAYGQNGDPLTGLSEGKIELKENGTELEPEEFQEISPGIQLVIAVNSSPPLGIQDVLGNSRLHYIKEALISWLSASEGSAPDDLSLISNDGLEVTHRASPSDLISALEGYNPQPRETAADFSVLSDAVQLAADPLKSPGGKRIVLFFSPPPTPQEIGGLESLISQAVESGVRIYPIQISSPAFFGSVGAEKLQEMASQTGGDFFPYAGIMAAEEQEQTDNDQEATPEPPQPYESLPDLADLLDRYRNTYLLSYQSQITTSGTHQVEITIEQESTLLTASREFSLQVDPPNAALLNPPQLIVRENPQPGNPDLPLVEYQPQEVRLEAYLEFPDDLPRELTETTLRVNGEVVDQNTSAPYDQFVWDISQIRSPGIYYLTVEVVDELGLRHSSLRTPIEVLLDTPEPSLTTIFNENRLGFFGLAVILALGLGFLVMILRGIIQPRGFPGNNAFFSKSRPGQKSSPRQAAFRQGNGKPLPVMSRPPSGNSQPSLQRSPFRLIAVNEAARAFHPQPYSLPQDRLMIGSQKSAVDLAVSHPSVSPQHALLDWDDQQQSYRIADQGTDAGTWVNYSQLEGEQLLLLKNGDIIHFGQAGFRFQQAD